jgi:hypothetical protein
MNQQNSGQQPQPQGQLQPVQSGNSGPSFSLTEERGEEEGEEAEAS